MNKEKLHNLIGRYFEGLLSTEEERKLLKLLLRQKDYDAEAEEALAVMLASGATGMRHTQKRRRPLSSAWSAVAGVALLAALAVTAIHYSSGHGDQEMMVAYVGGVKVSDKDKIKCIIENQLGDIRSASEFVSEEVHDDLNDIMEAFNDDELWAEI